MKAYEWKRWHSPVFIRFKLHNGIRIRYDGAMNFAPSLKYDLENMKENDDWKIVDIELTPKQKAEMVRLLMEQQ